MKEALSVEVTGARPERVPADLLVTPFFSTDRPLRGPAGRVDWRLCGLLSERAAEGLLSGSSDEATLVANPRSLRARRVMLLGLGARGGFGADAMLRAAEQAVRRGAELRAGVVALALPGEAASGLAPERRAAAAVRGAAAALAGATSPLRLVLVVEPGEVGATARALADLSRQPGRTAVPFRPAASEGTRPQLGASTASPDRPSPPPGRLPDA